MRYCKSYCHDFTVSSSLSNTLYLQAECVTNHHSLKTEGAIQVIAVTVEKLQR